MDKFEIFKKEQEELMKYLKGKLIENGYKGKIINPSQYLFAIGEIPVLLVAHLDTVHKELPKNIYYDKKQKVIWSPQGIGGDDRCGVIAILEIIKEYKPYILFTTDEEIGGLGATQFTEDVLLDLKEEINFMIEIDRHGFNDAVFYDCGNKEFQEYILGFGFEEKYGTFSDISVLSPAYDIASVNLSSGYYNEHSKQEYVDLTDLYSTIDKVKLILDDNKNHKQYDYQEIVYTPTTTTQNYCSDSYLYDDYFKLTDDEFLRYYGFEKPETFAQFLKEWNY